MYPTVNSLMNLWRFSIAREIRVLEKQTKWVKEFLRNLTAANLFEPDTWKKLTAYVKIIPDGDILPARCKYSLETNDWQVGVNHLYAKDEDPNNALWFSLPDVVASVLLTGRIPKIVDAFRIVPRGILGGLKPTRLRGAVRIDPRNQDFFKVVIEERKRLSGRKDIAEAEKEQLDKSLKVLANAASYGIYAEMNRQETEDKVEVLCHGIDQEPFKCRVAHAEVPGEFCFPPLASLITGGARLMLALLEHSVKELEGTYAMEDTDSMAIVATKNGGPVACPGGPLRINDGLEAIQALSWKQVGEVRNRFRSLNPYRRHVVPGSILKVEDDNFDASGKQRQLYCYAISAKRYALFMKGSKGKPVLLRRQTNNKSDKWSEHGLGHLLNPIDPESEDRDWIGHAWENMILKSLSLSTRTPSYPDRVAVGRLSVSSPAVLKPLACLNSEKRYANQIKPFNFLLSCLVAPFGHPIGADPERFHLIGPYESNPKKWKCGEWIDQYSGKSWGITTTGQHGSRIHARAKTYGDILTEYEFHPESKCADSQGHLCGRQTVGLLQRRHVLVGLIKYIGKESNSLEEVGAGLVHSDLNVYTGYVDPRRDEWTTTLLPALKNVSLGLLQEKCKGFLSRRAIIDLRAGRSRPHRKNREQLEGIARQLGLI